VVVAAAVIILGIIALPLTVPILPVDKIVPYEEALGIKTTRTEVAHSGPLPQHFGDEFGWEEMVQTVASVYNSMPSEQRAKTGILAGNYWEAGAIDFFGYGAHHDHAGVGWPSGLSDGIAIRRKRKPLLKASQTEITEPHTREIAPEEEEESSSFSHGCDEIMTRIWLLAK